MNISRSPFFYVGDKYKLIPQLKQHFPKKIGKFIEPFCGGGSVFLNVQANQYCLNDIDSKMIELHQMLYSYRNNEEEFFYEVVKQIDKYKLSKSFIRDIVPIDLKQQYKKTYYAHFNKESYTKMKVDYNNSNDLIILYLLLIYGFNRFLRFNSQGLFNLPVGNVDFNKNVEKSLKNYFNWVLNKDIKYYNLDFENFIDQINITQDDFVYVDPPYLISNSEYNKIWGDEEESRLLRCLDKLHKNGIKFALSNVIEHKDKKNIILFDWSKNYNIVPIQSNYISYHDNTVKLTTKEVLITNF